MRIVIQRVSEASVSINQQIKAKIDAGMVILIGVEEDDTEADADWLVAKIANLRIFDDEKGVMNLSVMDVEGELLVISQFTLHASTRKGNRPSYIKAARPEKAIPLYEYFCANLEKQTGIAVQTGEFGADMQVALINNGPVTIIIDSTIKE